MAKGQKRSGREPKKPKIAKKKHELPAYLAQEAASQSVLKVIPEANAGKR